MCDTLSGPTCSVLLQRGGVRRTGDECRGRCSCSAAVVSQPLWPFSSNPSCCRGWLFVVRGLAPPHTYLLLRGRRVRQGGMQRRDKSKEIAYHIPRWRITQKHLWSTFADPLSNPAAPLPPLVRALLLIMQPILHLLVPSHNAARGFDRYEAGTYTDPPPLLLPCYDCGSGRGPWQ
jgi:hypothetical protein